MAQNGQTYFKIFLRFEALFKKRLKRFIKHVKFCFSSKTIYPRITS